MDNKIKGSIRDIPVSALLRSLYHNYRTGVLDIVRHNTIKKLLYQDGQIVFAVSSDINDRIGVYCLKRAFITLHELEQAIKTQKHDRIGSVLLEMGAISEKDLIISVQKHLEEIVYSIFSFSDGEYVFTEKEVPSEKIKIKLSTGSLIFNGVKRMNQWDTIRKVVGGLDSVYCLSNNPIFRYQELKLSGEERHILESIDGNTQNYNICKVSGLSDYLTYKTLFGFISCGIIDRVYKFQSPVNNIIVEIDNFYKDIGRKKYHEIFGLAEAFTKKELEDNYKKMVQKFHPDKLHKITDKEIKIKGIKILKKVLSSYEKLSSLSGK